MSRLQELPSELQLPTSTVTPRNIRNATLAMISAVSLKFEQDETPLMNRGRRLGRIRMRMRLKLEGKLCAGNYQIWLETHRLFVYQYYNPSFPVDY